MRKLLIIISLVFATAFRMYAAEKIVNFECGDFLLNRGGKVLIYVDDTDQKGIAIAAENLCEDIRKVTGSEVKLTNDPSNATIVVGSIGSSRAIDKLVKEKKLDGKLLENKWEKYLLTLVDRQLIIAGSDRRGAIYGIYELSAQMGVSPWYYWADVPVIRHEHIYIKKGVFTDGEPAVRYRGFFLNDEDPCLTSWVKNTFGTNYGGHEFYAKVFELLLRLKGNMLWPAMWCWSFYADDPLNSRTADEMGVVMGTSHHEPMARNHQEWARRRNKLGAWDYTSNQHVIDNFFREGIQRAKHTEDIITIGMRGDGDAPMGGKEGEDHKAIEKDIRDMRLLKKVFENQRRIIKDVSGRPAEERPQIWAVYKEVQRYFNKGLRPPKDVTILLTDDNWGDITRLPDKAERYRPGGWGMYYHVDFVGAPRNSKWLNVTPIHHLWEQMTLAYQYGVDRMWMLNVGDLKPMEYPLTLFMDMAWNPTQYTAGNLIKAHTTAFCIRQFGAEYAPEAARILTTYCQYAGRVTPEMLDKSTYNLATGEWKNVTDDFVRLEAEALRLYRQLPAEYHDAYDELVLFPVQAMANLYQMYYAQAMNHKLFADKNPEANRWADEVERAFRRDSLLCARYNKVIAGGKWNGMMTQKHIGYTSWNDNFPKDVMPEVFRLEHKGDGGYTYLETERYVAMEAPHYYSKTNPHSVQWTEIPHIGRTLGGMSVQPYNESVNGASLTYRFVSHHKDCDSVNVHIIVKSTLDFLSKGGLTYRVSLDGNKPVSVNFNHLLNERKENVYSIYYPTVARRVVESIIRIPVGTMPDGVHTFTLYPDDPGIVFEKIVVDYGGYKPSYLFMPESAKVKD